MTKTQCSVTQAYFAAVFNSPDVAPLADSFSVKIPLAFAGMTSMQKINGTYNPNNDVYYIIQGLLARQLSPDWFMFLCDAPVWLGSSNFQYLSAPVNRFTFMSFAPGSNLFDGFALDGQTNVPVPMAQNSPVNFTLIYGQGTVS